MIFKTYMHNVTFNDILLHCRPLSAEPRSFKRRARQLTSRTGSTRIHRIHSHDIISIFISMRTCRHANRHTDAIQNKKQIHRHAHKKQTHTDTRKTQTNIETKNQTDKHCTEYNSSLPHPADLSCRRAPC